MKPSDNTIKAGEFSNPFDPFTARRCAALEDEEAVRGEERVEDDVTVLDEAMLKVVVGLVLAELVVELLDITIVELVEVAVDIRNEVLIEIDGGFEVVLVPFERSLG